MKRLIVRVLVAIPLVVLTAAAALFGYAEYLVNRTWDAPYPNVKADLSPEGIAHGAAIFRTGCEACHLDRERNRVAGAPLADVPKALGTFASANITAHPTAGIGRLTDRQIARQIRYAVNRHDRFTIMPSSGMSDADLAAVIGFLRSKDPLFAPDAKPSGSNQLSALARMIVVSSGAFKVPERPATIVAPRKGADAAWGRYLVENLYGCGDCHTKGFQPEKIHGPKAYAGGGELIDAEGKTIYPPNITFDATGLAGWTADDLGSVLRDGVRKDGTIVRWPMLRYRALDDTDVAAIHAFLSNVPKRANVVPRTAAPRLAHSDDPARMFVRLGCTTCHAPGAQYHDRLAQARGKNVEDVARWIRHPEQFRPGTPMPTYEKLVDEDAAVRLARYVQGMKISRQDTPSL